MILSIDTIQLTRNPCLSIGHKIGKSYFSCILYLLKLFFQLISSHIITTNMLYSSNLLTPTWLICKNISSVDYERSISFRKCNRWKSYEIVHVCLNNKKCYNIQYDYDVGQWRLGQGVSEHCLRSESRWFDFFFKSSDSAASDIKKDWFFLEIVGFNYIVLCCFCVHCFSSAVLLNKIKL